MSDVFDDVQKLYEELYEVSISIGQLIEIGDMSAVGSYIDLKENVIKKIEALLPHLDGSELSQIAEICKKIDNQEQMNITVLTAVQDKLKKELSKANKKTKLANAYSNVETRQGNLLDFRQ